MEKRQNFILETGKIIVPVDSELFNIGFQSSSDIQPNGKFWVHERCLKWSLGHDSDKLTDYNFIQTLALNASERKMSHM